MDDLQQLLANNRAWAHRVRQRDPEFFSRLLEQQSPKYLWIGCSDSRVPANEIVDLLPGELFVHRNVANVVVHTDFNCLSVIQYAVESLKVEHIIVCGHYGCGGVRAALQQRDLGLIDNWLRHVKDVWQENQAELSMLESNEARLARLCELNVVEGVFNVCSTTIVQSAWSRGQRVDVSGWIYDVADGVLRDLNVRISSAEDLSRVYRIKY